MTKVFLDTDYLYALQDVDDSQHKKAVELTLNIGKYEVLPVISTNILLEVLTLVSQRISKARAIKLRTEFRSGRYQVVNPNDELVMRAEELFDNTRSKNVSYSDCLSIVIARQLNILWVLSFDIHFKQQGLKRLGKDGWF